MPWLCGVPCVTKLLGRQNKTYLVFNCWAPCAALACCRCWSCQRVQNQLNCLRSVAATLQCPWDTWTLLLFSSLQNETPKECKTEEVAKWLCSVGIKISLCYLLLYLSLVHWKQRYFHGWDVTRSSFYPYRGNRCTKLHFWYPCLLSWLLPGQLSSSSPGTAMQR